MIIELSVSDAFKLRSILAMVVTDDLIKADAKRLHELVTSEIANETAPKK